jgi:hypothetical protein
MLIEFKEQSILDIIINYKKYFKKVIGKKMENNNLKASALSSGQKLINPTEYILASWRKTMKSPNNMEYLQQTIDDLKVMITTGSMSLEQLSKIDDELNIAESKALRNIIMRLSAKIEYQKGSLEVTDESAQYFNSYAFGLTITGSTEKLKMIAEDQSFLKEMASEIDRHSHINSELILCGTPLFGFDQVFIDPSQIFNILCNGTRTLLDGNNEESAKKFQSEIAKCIKTKGSEVEDTRTSMTYIGAIVIPNDRKNMSDLNRVVASNDRWLEQMNSVRNKYGVQVYVPVKWDFLRVSTCMVYCHEMISEILLMNVSHGAEVKITDFTLHAAPGEDNVYFSVVLNSGQFEGSFDIPMALAAHDTDEFIDNLESTYNFIIHGDVSELPRPKIH